MIAICTLAGAPHFRSERMMARSQWGRSSKIAQAFSTLGGCELLAQPAISASNASAANGEAFMGLPALLSFVCSLFAPA